MRPLLIFFAVIVGIFSVLAIVGCENVVGASAPVLQGDNHRRYHDGKRWVEVTVALDRLHVERIGAAEDQRSIEVYILRKPAVSAAALDDVARQMLAAQKEIHSISAYVVTADEPGAQPVRLTRQLAVCGSPGQDLESIAARCGARVIERVDYSADTAICLATGASLLAAFDAADALRQQSGVVFAMPLIKRANTLRTR